MKMLHCYEISLKPSEATYYDEWKDFDNGKSLAIYRYLFHVFDNRYPIAVIDYDYNYCPLSNKVDSVSILIGSTKRIKVEDLHGFKGKIQPIRRRLIIVY